MAKIQQYFERKLCLFKLTTFTIPLFQNLQKLNLYQAHKSNQTPNRNGSNSVHPPKVVLYQYQVWFWLKDVEGGF